MPVYSYRCVECDTTVDKFRSIPHRDDTTPCDTCGHPMQRHVAYGMQVVGATVTKPIDMTKQLGRSFDSNASYRKYLSENNVREVHKKDFRGSLDANKQRRETVAQAQGYRDYRQKVSEVKKKAAAEPK